MLIYSRRQPVELHREFMSETGSTRSRKTHGAYRFKPTWGAGYVASAFGYASAYAGLQLFVRDHSTGDVYVTTTDIYNKSADGFGFDITRFDGNLISALYYVPVHANSWYEVWGGAVQHAYAGGIVADAVSNFDMYVSPIAASGIIIF